MSSGSSILRKPSGWSASQRVSQLLEMLSKQNEDRPLLSSSDLESFPSFDPVDPFDPLALPPGLFMAMCLLGAG